jgi:hypothetical protein
MEDDMRHDNRDKAYWSMVVEAQHVANKLVEALEPFNHDIARLERFGPIVLENLKGVSRDVWWILDEKPGYFGKAFYPGVFWMVRQVRNHPEYSKDLFAGLINKSPVKSKVK